MAKRVQIGDTVFPTKKSARAHFLGIRDQYEDGSSVSSQHFKELSALYSKHPDFADRSRYRTPLDFSVQRSDQFRTRCFFAHYDDGYLEDFSIDTCVNNSVVSQ